MNKDKQLRQLLEKYYVQKHLHFKGDSHIRPAQAKEAVKWAMLQHIGFVEEREFYVYTKLQMPQVILQFDRKETLQPSGKIKILFCLTPQKLSLSQQFEIISGVLAFLNKATLN